MNRRAHRADCDRDTFSPERRYGELAGKSFHFFREIRDGEPVEGVSDRPGLHAKFAVPTIANGKVYIATQHEVTVYGLK